MEHQESHRHHFVPKFLLRPWLSDSADGRRLLSGYWWDQHNQRLACKRRGLNSFCFQIDLLTLKQHRLGRDAIERGFFGEVDAKGSLAREIILEHGADKLTLDQRCDFARLLLSLDLRRPRIVERLRSEALSFAEQLDTDPEVQAALASHGIHENASRYAENELGWCLEDSAVAMIQKLVDNPAVGQRLINGHWNVRRFDPSSGSLVLSDRPLIRLHGYNRPGATWVLPLTPHAVFLACNHPTNIQKLMRLSDQRMVKETNKSSLGQTERFVFSIDEFHEQWLGGYLRRRHSRVARGTVS